MAKATPILVQKFGGTSVATPESRALVQQRIIEAHQQGYAVVVVISAMGRRGAPYATDTLLDLLRSDCPGVRTRESDLIFSCGEIIAGTVVTANLQQQGYRATYLTGGQAGIVTNAEHGDARVLDVNTDRLSRLLAVGEIVVVAGGQGATEEGEITTLGRGGSDTTACALGVALDAERIEIYTDVEGVMTADPRLVPEAQLLAAISHRTCCLMAQYGAKVMHPRSVETAAQKPWIPLRVKSTFSSHPGTLIDGEPRCMGERPQPVAVAAQGGQTAFEVDAALMHRHLKLLGALMGQGVTPAKTSGKDPAMLLAVGRESADHLADTLLSHSIPFTRTDGLARISMVGENLTKSPQLIAEFNNKMVAAGGLPLAMTGNLEVISAWVPEQKTQAVARAVHDLVVNHAKMVETA